MQQCPSLTESKLLARLVKGLEPNSTVLGVNGNPAFSGAFLVPLAEDPGRRLLYVFPSKTPDARAEGEKRWLREHKQRLIDLAKGSSVSLCTVVFPGAWPTRQFRQQVGGFSVRIVSAVHHLWADRLRVHDDEGNVDESLRVRTLERLGGRWGDEEERRYTDPALEPAVATDLAEKTRTDLLRPNPDVPLGGITVIYGPGGIGKTFFLRRISNRMAKAAVADPTIGIPVFAELPLLLHRDSLENWLSHAGVRLPIEAIEVLVRYAVITPALDALDELVRGQALEGSRAFLRHLRQTVEPEGRSVLSSRDYYLNLDPLVRDELGGTSTPELTIGFFSKAGRRRYVEMRTGLTAKDASKWATRLEEQTRDALQSDTESEIDTLIGHPLFLDAFCQIILDIPKDRQSVAADDFRITSPDAFGEIVDAVLSREHEKVRAGWDVKFGGRLVGRWNDPFTPPDQRAVFRNLVLLVAKDGGAEVVRRGGDDSRYRQLRHGLFSFTAGLPSADDASPQGRLREILRREMGDPEIDPAVPDEEHESLGAAALDDLVSFYRQHPLTDTSPNLPDDAVLVPRHRAYFDYLLADALLDQLNSMTSLDADERMSFVFWCLDHHIFEREDQSEGSAFAGCLDFVLWHRSGLLKATELLDSMFQPGNGVDQELASYVLTLGLALVLRSGARREGARVEMRDFAPATTWEIQVIDSIVPSVAGLTVLRCSFPNLRLVDVSMRDVVIQDSDFAGLSVSDCAWSRVRFQDCVCSELKLDKRVRLTECTLDFDELQVLSMGPSLDLSLERCKLSPAVADRIREHAQLRPDIIRMTECEVLEPREEEAFSPGRLFVNRLMTLLRRDGHEEFGVFLPKLRGLTRTTGATFPSAVRVLGTHGCTRIVGEILALTEEAAGHMYSGKGLEGQRRYEDVADYWDPVVTELDRLLG